MEGFHANHSPKVEYVINKRVLLVLSQGSQKVSRFGVVMWVNASLS